jgi:hypothetical protein
VASVADLAIIVPSRGRPRQFAELVAAVHRTASGTWRIWVGLDDDDPSDYLSGLAGFDADLIAAFRGERRSLSAWTNHLAAQALDSHDPPRYLASLGDDHRPRTGRWDRTLIEAIEGLDGPGWAYGNDLFQGAALPTAWVTSAETVRALGWLMLPACQHLYVDAAVLELGRAAGRIAYRPDVIVEHLHPAAGKATWDDSYRASNSRERDLADRAAFQQWKADGLDTDVAALTAADLARAGMGGT